MDKKINISFIIPCYNSTSTIGSVIQQILHIMQSRPFLSYEILLINDNCQDSTYDVIQELCKKFSFIKGVQFSKNFGQHAAIMAGFAYSKGEIIVTADDDGQTPLDEVFTLIDKLNEGYDVVFASYQKKKHSVFRNWGTLLNNYMAQLLIGKPKSIFLSSYFVTRRFVIDKIKQYENPYPYLAGLILRVTKNITNVGVNHRPRLQGTSNYTLFKLIKMWLDGFTAFSVKPLRVASILGIAFAFIGFLWGVFTVFRRLFNPNILAGYSSIMALMLFIGGILMIILGLIGEYVGRIYISLNNAPQYVVRETLNIEK